MVAKMRALSISTSLLTLSGTGFPTVTAQHNSTSIAECVVATAPTTPEHEAIASISAFPGSPTTQRERPPLATVRSDKITIPDESTGPSTLSRETVTLTKTVIHTLTTVYTQNATQILHVTPTSGKKVRPKTTVPTGPSTHYSVFDYGLGTATPPNFTNPDCTSTVQVTAPQPEAWQEIYRGITLTTKLTNCGSCALVWSTVHGTFSGTDNLPLITDFISMSRVFAYTLVAMRCTVPKSLRYHRHKPGKHPPMTEDPLWNWDLSTTVMPTTKRKMPKTKAPN
jgi:hypothetical protein